MAQANVKLTVDATGATRALKGVQNQTNQLQKSFGGIKTAIAGIGFTVLAKQTISTTANFKTLQLRMKGLTSEYGEFAQVQELVTKAQDKFNLSIVEATKSVTDIFARLRPLGIELKDIETAFIGFNTLAVAAGLNASEMNAAFTQLAQGLGSGQLQGDEFRSIAEQIPQLLSAISKETGIAEGKLKSFASKGLLKTDIIIRALANSTEKYQDTVDDIIKDSPEAAFKAFSNAALELQLTLGDKLLPSIVAITKASTAFVKAITDFVDSEAGQVTLAFIGIAAAIKGISVVAPIVIAQAVAFKASLIGVGVGGQIATGSLVATNATLAATAAGFTSATAAATAFKVALAKTGIGLAVIGFGLLVTEILKAVNAQKEFNELLDTGSSAAIQTEIDTTKEKISELQKKIKEITKDQKGFTMVSGAEGFEQQLKKANEELEKLEKRLPITQGVELAREFDKTLKTLREKNKELKVAEERIKIETEEGRKQFDLEQRKEELVEKYGEELAEIIIEQDKENQKLKDSIDLYKKKKDAAEKLKETLEAVGEEIEKGIKDNLRDAITGAQSFGDAMSNVLNKIRDKLLDLVLDQALSGLGGNIGKFLGNIFKVDGEAANGGPVSAGKTYLVGEKGPELLTMGSSGGFVTPNNKIGGESVTNNIVVNVDASGTAVQGDDANANQFGEQLAAAIQAEIINQKRSGGLLS